ncbi:MAG: amidohydrolase family protein [Methyloceanibacter sp.]
MAKDPKRPIHVGLATNLGAGTSFSLMQTMNEAYKIASLNCTPLTAFEGLYLATLGGAEALGLEDRIGSLQVALRPRRCSPSARHVPARWKISSSC